MLAHALNFLNVLIMSCSIVHLHHQFIIEINVNTFSCDLSISCSQTFDLNVDEIWMLLKPVIVNLLI